MFCCFTGYRGRGRSFYKTPLQGSDNPSWWIHPQNMELHFFLPLRTEPGGIRRAYVINRKADLVILSPDAAATTLA